MYKRLSRKRSKYGRHAASKRNVMGAGSRRGRNYRNAKLNNYRASKRR